MKCKRCAAKGFGGCQCYDPKDDEDSNPPQADVSDEEAAKIYANELHPFDPQGDDWCFSHGGNIAGAQRVRAEMANAAIANKEIIINYGIKCLEDGYERCRASMANETRALDRAIEVVKKLVNDGYQFTHLEMCGSECPGVLAHTDNDHLLKEIEAIRGNK